MPSELLNILTLRGGYNTTVVIVASTLLGASSGLVGSFALLRKRSLMADALSHATLPGICVAFIVSSMLGMDGKSVPVLLTGGAVTGVLAVFAVQLILRHTRLKEDAAIGIALSVFFGVGVVLQSYIQTMPGGDQGGLGHFIFGQTASMRLIDAVTMGAVALLAIAATAVLWKELALVCFNDSFAHAQGYRVQRIDLLMMSLIVIVTVIGIQAVGLILILAMLVIPPASARFWTEKLWAMLALALVFGGASGYAGASISAIAPNAPAGSVIVLSAGVLFLFSFFVAPERGLIARSWRALRLRMRMAEDHLVEALHDAPSDDYDKTRAHVARERGWGPLTTRIVSAECAWRGYVRDGALTDEGWTRGERIARNHRLWEQYLVSYADIAPSHVDWSVDQVEHVLSDELVRELEELLTNGGANEGAAT